MNPLMFAQATEADETAHLSPRENVLARIHKRKADLARAATVLKQRFVGLDIIIDQIIRNMEVWYVTPEFVARPVIVNLWGMTGVGKTDLVRTLVRELSLNETFLEVQMRSGGGSSSSSNSHIQSELQCSNIEPGQPGILLLDEIQRFRTVDEDGKEIKDYGFQDTWMLLSDGKFSGKTDRDDMLSLMFEDMMWSVPYEEDEEKLTEEQKQQKKEREERKKQMVYRRGYYNAKRIKKVLRLSDPVEEIMKWDDDKKYAVLSEKMNDPAMFEGDDYSKLLIFISGNLDEAYQMSHYAEDADHDADVLHAFSLKINVVSIKAALLKRFKPEQISRFGNTHVIYPSLSKLSYQTIISRRLETLADSVRKEHGIEIEFDQTVSDFVYRNGVFPAQGTRPLFSTFSSYIENSVPAFLLAAVESNATRVRVSHSNQHLIGEVEHTNGTIKSVKVEAEGMLDVIKEQESEDSRVHVSIHEAGHAVAYCKLFGLVPTQIVSNSTSAYANGFISTHEFCQTRESVLNMLTVYMAGQAAEEMVFGESIRSNGASGDISQATRLISAAVRCWGFFDNKSRIMDPHWQGSEIANNNNDPEISQRIESEVADALLRARTLLREQRSFFEEISGRLITDGQIKPTECADLCIEYGIDAKVLDPKEKASQPYAKLWRAFRKAA